MSHRQPWLRFAALLLILCLLPQYPAFAAKKSETVKAQSEIQSTRSTMIRATVYKSAKSSAKKIKVLPAGTSVSVVSEAKGWVKISLNGKTGYMKAKAFEAPPEKTPKPAKTPKPTKQPKPSATPKPSKEPAQKGAFMTVVADDARIYKKASESASSSHVSRGTQLRVLNVDSKWCKVTLDGETGYMPTLSFVAVTTENTKMYKNPSTDAKSSALKKGAKLMVIERDDNWTKVRKDKNTGYVRTERLRVPGVEPDPTAAPTPNAAKVTKAEKASITPEPTDKPPEVVAEATPVPQPKSTSPDEDAEAKGAKKAKTTVKSYMYQKPSTSAKRVTVKAGTTVAVYTTSGSWAKVKVGGKGGYMRLTAFDDQPNVTPKPTATPKPTDPYKKLKTGSSGAAVTALQKRLEVLGYLNTIPNSKYTSTTATSVREFQGNAKIKKTGIADNATQVALFASGAPESSILTMKLQKGDKGTAVKRLQMRLKAKGFGTGAITGLYNDATREAVKRYQTQLGLKVDGVAGNGTLTSLFSEKAPNYNGGQPTASPSATVAPTATPKPTATPEPTKTPSAQDSATRKKKVELIVDAAMAKLGLPYVYGASGPNSFDCSGFTMYAYGVAGVSLPHSAYQQGYSCGEKVTRAELQRGDLVFWNTVSDSDLSDHAGIYLGNGQAIHASSGTGRVIISTIDSGYYQRVFSWGRNVLG